MRRSLLFVALIFSLASESLAQAVETFDIATFRQEMDMPVKI
jgi:hypothetical protein